ncbi:hypothetical protein [Sulfobacillus thermosulfidooxidans]|uniref:hypothetical protein n=1 Tax=Sulfobacillus thermosulfidooxidans TaxID=28034 RepID=UPI0006B4E0D7|nr:hypothetical protein [Sulfobacillus thermosulfidooxidans]
MTELWLVGFLLSLFGLCGVIGWSITQQTQDFARAQHRAYQQAVHQAQLFGRDIPPFSEWTDFQVQHLLDELHDDLY